MTALPSPIAIMLGLSFSKALFFVVTFLAFIFLLRFACFYIEARSQFPGPPVKNFWIGNLDQIMADNVHEMVGHAFNWSKQ